MRFHRRAVLGLACGLLAALPAAAADLELSVANLSDSKGWVMIAVYNSAQSFPKAEQRLAAVVLPANGGTVRALLDLPPGRYAVAAFHDANGNGKLDGNLVGMPTEGYGFSRDARGSMGPPAFDSAAFDLPAGGSRQTITLSY